MGIREDHASAGGQEDDELHVVAFAASDWRAQTEAREILWLAISRLPFYTLATSGSEDHP